MGRALKPQWVLVAMLLGACGSNAAQPDPDDASAQDATVDSGDANASLDAAGRFDGADGTDAADGSAADAGGDAWSVDASDAQVDGATDAGRDAGRPIVWGFVGTGQSLSTGGHAGNTPYAPVFADAGPNHFMLGNLTGSGGIAPTASPDASWTLATLSEPMRGIARATQWPTNIMNQSLHTPMAARLSALVPGVRTAHIAAGQNGQPMAGIKKGGNVPSYIGSIAEASRMKQLFDAQGYDYRIAAVLLTHGESDLGSATYGDQVLDLQANYDADLRAITGQSGTIPMILSQPSAGFPQPGVGLVSNINDQIFSAWLTHRSRLILAGSKLGLSYWANDYHLDAAGSRDLGYLYAEAARPLVDGSTAFEPLYPVSVTRNGNVVTVVLNRPAVFDSSFWGTTHAGTFANAWATARGFEAVNSGGSPIEITSVALSGGTATITCAAAPAWLSHAMYGDGPNTIRRTQVRDGAGNWLVQFTRAL
jgi:hypothetical protein